MTNKNEVWQQEHVEDGDKIVCPICGKPHTLSQGMVHGVRVGDGVLFYRCGNRSYIGAINRRTAFGVRAYDDQVQS